MKALTNSPSSRLALVAGIACALVFALLGWAGTHGAGVQAAEAGPDAVAAAQPRSLEAAWPSMQPVTFSVIETWLPHEWVMAQYGITITFPGGSVSAPAVFTFTPHLSSALPTPMVPTPYFFALEGTYDVSAASVSEFWRRWEEDERDYADWFTPSATLNGPVSLAKRITIALHYDQAELAPVLEQTLLMVQFDPFYNEWRRVEEVNGILSVDTIHDQVSVQTRSLQLFALAGYRSRQCLPLIHKNASAALHTEQRPPQ